MYPPMGDSELRRHSLMKKRLRRFFGSQCDDSIILLRRHSLMKKRLRPQDHADKPENEREPKKTFADEEAIETLLVPVSAAAHNIPKKTFADEEAIETPQADNVEARGSLL